MKAGGVVLGTALALMGIVASYRLLLLGQVPAWPFVVLVTISIAVGVLVAQGSLPDRLKLGAKDAAIEAEWRTTRAEVGASLSSLRALGAGLASVVAEIASRSNRFVGEGELVRFMTSARHHLRARLRELAVSDDEIQLATSSLDLMIMHDLLGNVTSAMRAAGVEASSLEWINETMRERTLLYGLREEDVVRLARIASELPARERVQVDAELLAVRDHWRQEFVRTQEVVRRTN